jgi:proline racemase
LHYARGDLGVGEEIVIESILGSTMKVRVIGTARFGDFDAVIPEVAGTASITGQSRFYFDPADPFQAGFFLR